MKIALVHDWFNEAGGAERVVKEILHCYPEADVYCLFDFFDQEHREEYLMGKCTRKSFIRLLPFVRKHYRALFPLFPMAISRLNLKAYDLILSSSSCVAKGVKRRKGQLHISYCHSPARYAWDLRDDYLRMARNPLSRALMAGLFNRLRRWDVRSSDRVDHFIANSRFVGQRIHDFFGRKSTVIYPPVDVSMKDTGQKHEDYYITVSRLVTYKNVDMIIEAFRLMPELRLELAGKGPLKKRILKNLPENVSYLGYIDEDTKVRKIAGAKAFVAAATEDIGISIVEAQSYGTPVIIPEIGGYKETVNKETGVFFKSKTIGDLVEAVRGFEQSKREFRRSDFEENIRPFSIDRFRKEYKAFVDERYAQHMAGKNSSQQGT